MRRLLSALCICLAGVSAAPGAWAQGRELKVLSGFDGNFLFSREVAKPFLETIAKATGGRVTARFNGPESVPVFEQLQPVTAGVFDMLFTHPAYHSGTTTVGLSTDAIDGDPVKRRDSGVWDFVDRHYGKFGLKLIAITPLGTKGFLYVVKKPIGGPNGLAGLKVRGTVSYHPMIKALGGAPVVLSPGETYTALERGVVDAAAWGTTGVEDLRLHEVAKYMVRSSFGQGSLMILMNRRAFDALPEADRSVILEEGRKLELATVRRFDQIVVEEWERLKGKGMLETSFAPEDTQRLDKLWADGVWEVATAKNEDARALRTLATEKGVTR